MLPRTASPQVPGAFTARSATPALDLWSDPAPTARPLPALTDAERAVMDDLFRQASRLSAAAAWVGVLLVVALVALLVLR
jgi:hypothetical protein